MSQVIWKFPLEESVSMPQGAEILHVNSQHGAAMIWAKVDPKEERVVDRQFCTFGTGHHIEDDDDRLAFIGTWMLARGSLVFHTFEILP